MITTNITNITTNDIIRAMVLSLYIVIFVITPIWSNVDLQTFKVRDHHAPFSTWCIVISEATEKCCGSTVGVTV